jgi:uncharacterized membrane protein
MKRAQILVRLLIVALGVFLFLTSCNRKTFSSTSTVIKDSVVYNTKDSVIKRDSVVTHVKDSVVIREAVQTAFEVQPCDTTGKIKPFTYSFKKGNVLVKISMNEKGLLNADVDISAEEAYRLQLIQEFKQHFVDSVNSTKQVVKQSVNTDAKKEVVKVRMPWWFWAVVIAAVLIGCVELYIKFFR